MTQTFSITQDHIDRGKRLSCTECPLALCLSEGPYRYVVVKGYAVFLRRSLVHDGPMVEVKLPLSAQRFISRFDQGRRIEPFRFRLVLPPELES